jgi:predicted DNA-binding transcriptional regulator AlpA
MGIRRRPTRSGIRTAPRLRAITETMQTHGSQTRLLVRQNGESMLGESQLPLLGAPGETLARHETEGLCPPVRASVRELDQLLTLRDVQYITGRHRSTLHRWMQRGLFPQKHNFRGKKPGWRRSEIEEWLKGR